MTEAFLSDRGIDVSAIPIERFFALTWVGFVIGFILTVIYGPDGQKVFFITVLTTQLAWAIYGGYLHFWGDSEPSFDVTPQTHDHTLEMSLAHGDHLTHVALDAVIIAALLFTVFRLSLDSRRSAEVATITDHKDTKKLMCYTHLRAEDLVGRLG